MRFSYLTQTTSSNEANSLHGMILLYMRIEKMNLIVFMNGLHSRYAISMHIFSRFAGNEDLYVILGIPCLLYTSDAADE